MRAIILVLILFLNIRALIAQNRNDTDTVKTSYEDIYAGKIGLGMVEQMPTYKYGGEKGMQKFLQENIVFPEDSIYGKVYVTFEVHKDGSKSEPIILRGLSSATEKEAIRLVKLLEFNPAMTNGRNVACQLNLPIDFTKENERKIKKLRAKNK